VESSQIELSNLHDGEWLYFNWMVMMLAYLDVIDSMHSFNHLFRLMNG